MAQKNKTNNTVGLIIGSIIAIGAVAAIVNLSQPQVDEPEFPVVKIEENTRHNFAESSKILLTVDSMTNESYIFWNIESVLDPTVFSIRKISTTSYQVENLQPFMKTVEVVAKNYNETKYYSIIFEYSVPIESISFDTTNFDL